MSAVMLLVAYSFSFSLNSFNVITALASPRRSSTTRLPGVIAQSVRDRHHFTTTSTSDGTILFRRSRRESPGRSGVRQLPRSVAVFPDKSVLPANPERRELAHYRTPPSIDG